MIADLLTPAPTWREIARDVWLALTGRYVDDPPALPRAR